MPKEKENTIQKLKEMHERQLNRKAMQARENREKNNMLKENLMMTKAKTLNENIDKKKIIETQKKLQKNSIETYKVFKKIYLKERINEEIKKRSKSL